MKIVVVEDNEAVRESIEKVLAQEGHSVVSFENGEDAKAFVLVEYASIDVMVVDYLLPRLDGISLIKIIREAEISVPVLLLTARESVHDKVYGLQSGADYYLTKPFHFDELLACLDALYRRPTQYYAAQYQFTPAIIFTPTTRSITTPNGSIPLTPSESRILEYLFRHPNQTLSQEEIYEHAFDFAKENWSNTVEVHIKNLRKKLTHINYEGNIVTVRASGYRLEI